MRSEIVISFPDVSSAEADRSARDLSEQINRGLREENLSAVASQKRAESDTQNLGEIVSILLSGPAMVALSHGVATGIQKYMARTNRSRIEIKRPDGSSVLISDVESRHLERIISAIGADAS